MNLYSLGSRFMFDVVKTKGDDPYFYSYKQYYCPVFNGFFCSQSRTFRLASSNKRL